MNLIEKIGKPVSLLHYLHNSRPEMVETRGKQLSSSMALEYCDTAARHIRTIYFKSLYFIVNAMCISRSPFKTLANIFEAIVQYNGILLMRWQALLYP